MFARATNGLVLSVLVLGLSIIAVGRPALAAEGAGSGEFLVAQAGQPGQKLTKEERQKRRAARQKRKQERAAKRATRPAAQRNPNREGVRRAARPAPAARPAARAAPRRAAPPSPPARAARPARPNRAARPVRQQAAPPQRRVARPAPKRKRRNPFRKLERNVRKFIKKELRGDRRRAERRAAEGRRAEQARRNAARWRSFEGGPLAERRFDRRERRRAFNDGRRFERLEANRDLRDFRRREGRRQRITNRRAGRRLARSRRHLIRSQRYRNRFDRGYSIYYLPPAGVALAAGLYALDSSRASYDDYFDTFMAPPVRRLGRRYSMDEIIADPELRAAVRSVNIDIITFYSGSARIAYNQLDQLEDLADAIHATLRRRPDEVFLIAGHTDAVGPFDENLDLSERRAVAVQELLIREFGVPAQNLEAVGYGEQYLRVNTYGPDRRNRRVVVRAIGSLLAYR